MLGTTWLDWVGRTTPYHQRMVIANREQFPRMHATTVAKLQQVTLKLASFYPGDVRTYLDTVPHDAPVAMFPPFWCLERKERILTADLKWVPCGELVEGQQILAFDEHPEPGSRIRRWRYGTVTRSEPAVRECVRVHLENGDSVVCTTDHPWLTSRSLVGQTAEWIDASDLRRPSKYPTRDGLLSAYVYKAVDPWSPARTFEDGWLSGILDGEGTIMMPNGGGHGSAKVIAYQVPGRVADQAEAILRRHGFGLDVRAKTPSGFSKKTVHQITVSGGFREVLRVLGTFQPGRLMDRLRDDLDISLQTVRVNGAGGRTRVVAVEPVGPQAIQSISTSTGTYVGEGYLMHNSKGYVNMFRGLETHFDWPEPEFGELDEDGKHQIVAQVIDRPNWLLGLHFLDPELEEFRVGYVQVTPRAVPIWVYARPGKTRISGPRQPTKPILMAKITAGDVLGDRLALHPVDPGQFNTLRSMFLDTRIPPGAPAITFAVSCSGKLIGAFGCNKASYDPDGVYLMSDFPVGWSRYKRLAKLIVMAAMSTEAQQLLQRMLSKRLTRWSTTAFSDNPASAKYGRGIPGVHLASRKEAADGVHAWQLDYRGPLGAWSLDEALARWKRHHGQHLR